MQSSFTSRSGMAGLRGFAILISFMLVMIGACSTAADQKGDGAAPTPVPIATILASPDAFEGKNLKIHGRVQSVKRAVFPNGRSYYLLSVGDEKDVLTLFSWTRPSVKEGALVEAIGVFHVWRYNLRHMMDALQVVRVDRARSPGK